VQGSHPSWLTHTETQGNTIATDINVDGLFQKNQNQIHNGTPFGDQFSLEHDSWFDLYRKVCNLDYSPAKSPSPHTWMEQNANTRRRIPPICKLKIALMMRGSNPDWQYKYRPQHVIHDELCMVLQKRAFCIKNNSKTTKLDTGSYTMSNYDVHEISIHAFKSTNPLHILVHELAFGPDSDPQVTRPVALWFNIDEKKVIECTNTQAKRFRWKRGINKKDQSESPGGHGMNQADQDQSPAKNSPFAVLEHFVMIRPHDQDAYKLATRILEHRVSVQANELNPNMKDRFDGLKDLDQAKKSLQDDFENLRRYWVAWRWPINSGREIVTKKTPVPSVDGKYNFPKSPLPSLPFQDVHVPNDIARQIDFRDDDSNDEEDQGHVGARVRNIWESFLTQDQVINKENEVGCSKAWQL